MTHAPRLVPNLALRQTQTLAMTAHMQQALKLLALSNSELEGYLTDIIDSNILLERQTPEDLSEEMSERAADRAQDDDRNHTDTDGDDRDDGASEIAADNVDIQDGLFDGRSLSLARGIGGAEGPTLDCERLVAAPISLYQHLLTQADMTFVGSARRIADSVIALIDSAGYLRGDSATIATDLGVSRADVTMVIAKIQQFEPSGIGACSLSECLAIQARAADRYDPAMAMLLDNLVLLAEGKLAELQRLCEVDSEDLADMIAEIRAFNPRPGHIFDSAPPPMIIPDIYVHRTASGWVVGMNDDSLPPITLNRSYYQQLEQPQQSTAQNRQSRRITPQKHYAPPHWLAGQISEANWLIRTLAQRNHTILAVAQQIVTQQQDFFEQGPAALRPLTLRPIAEALEMHESTISRATSHKYLACSRGVFPLKYFFASAVVASDNSAPDIAATAVKEQIKQIITAENDPEKANKILSDDAIAAQLKQGGYPIARRTVVKYREALGFGSSVHRRRQKKLQAQKL